MIEDLELEEWRTIEEFPRYQVSNYGRVKSCIGIEKILTPNKVQGYLIVKLSNTPIGKGKYIQKCFKVHRLVAKYFCEGYAEDKQVHHIDRQRDNNFYKNLLCVTKAQHAAIHKQLKIDDDRAAASDNAAAFNLREKEIENNGSTESENNLHRENIRES